MKTHPRGAVFLLVLALVAIFSSAAFANEFTVTIKGAKQGPFRTGKAGVIQLYGYEFHVGYNRDTNGNTTGARKYDPIILRKDLDVASPQILQAMVTNEALTSVVIKAKIATKDGTVSQAYTITLEKARIVDVRQLPDAKGLHYEEVSIAFQKISVENGQSSSSDEITNVTN